MLCRITAVARLDERSEEADAVRARAATGDRESAWLLEQWHADHLVLARVSVEVRARDRARDTVRVARVIDGVWLERDVIPRVESQIADVAPAELRAVADELRALDVELDEEQLAGAFLHVELDAALRRALIDP